jgi:hypothetical protein
MRLEEQATIIAPPRHPMPSEATPWDETSASLPIPTMPWGQHPRGLPPTPPPLLARASEAQPLLGHARVPMPLPAPVTRAPLPTPSHMHASSSAPANPQCSGWPVILIALAIVLAGVICLAIAFSP